MMKLGRQQIIAIVALVAVLIVGMATPIVTVMAHADAAQSLAEDEIILQNFERAYLHGKHAKAAWQPSVAPMTAFLEAPTSGLASAQVEAYLARLVAMHDGSLISSSVLLGGRGDAASAIRIQATIDISYNDLQGLLFGLETGVPYVFVDAMTLQTASNSEATTMHVTLTLRALWRRSSS
jgi:general secretion pathway protein M